ncbi:DNA polymerase III subunit delta [Chondromyces apiculatus]|uniref:DNA-directed DNA polymerase n=1 Tax=Chondromyces apiculatus DSM 436 TaxID=1192034 RepID=A0A017TI31_9BACT|nr:DNA polymerase III subunit delta [Chondromyces apiculatus]EYF08490.1 DNA polymerase III delta subunit [Chondromyces apiculatus DSM 436]
MTPDQALKEASTGSLRPVYLVMGEERWYIDRVVSALREAASRGGIAGFNEDKFTAGEATAEAVLGAARMLPMMAPRRFILARGLERWEKKGDDGGDDDGKPDGKTAGKKGVSRLLPPLDALAEYAKEPAPSAVVVLVATKLHAQRKLVTMAKKQDFLVACEQLPRRSLPAFIRTVAKEKGNAISAEVADHLAEIAGPELGYVVDAIERLSLFVGEKQPITEEAVAEIVIRVRQSTTWELLDAIGHRRLDRAMATLADVYDPTDRGLKLLGLVAWSVRGLVKFDAALGAGLAPQEAAQRAGVPPFKAGEMAQTVRGLPQGTLPRWLRLLAETDLALKGSRRPPQAVLETMLMDMCAR